MSCPSACFPGSCRWRYRGAGGPGPAPGPVLAGAGRGLAEPPAAAALGHVQLPAGESAPGPLLPPRQRTDPDTGQDTQGAPQPGTRACSAGPAEAVAGLRGGFGAALKVCEGGVPGRGLGPVCRSPHRPVPLHGCRFRRGDRGQRGGKPEHGAGRGASGSPGGASSGEPQSVLVLLQGVPVHGGGRLGPILGALLERGPGKGPASTLETTAVVSSSTPACS